MGLATFKGGVHPYDGKKLAKDKPIEELLPKEDLIYPVSQHIGAPAVPVVKKGDPVKRGQLIAEPGGFVSAGIFSSVSGTVKAIEPRRNPTGDMVNSIIIENDGAYSEVEYSPVEDVSSLSAAEIVERVKNAGVVGMGGAGFPTHVKLSPKEPDKIDSVIANCAECEPYITADYRCMLEMPEKLIAGMRIMLQIFPNATGYFGIENNKPDCIEKISALVKDEPRMKVVPLKTKYPQGGERQLIYAITHREINSKMLPADAGCIVDNVGTIMAIYDAVKEGKPLIDRVMTVTGDAISEPKNFLVHIGTNYKELIEACGGFKTEPKKIISGGPMMGFAMYSTDIPTTKTTSDLLALTKDEDAESDAKATACINCGRCVDACPEKLVPSRLCDFAETFREEDFVKWNGVECVECGSCSFVCPAKRRLAQGIKSMKKIALANMRKK